MEETWLLEPLSLEGDASLEEILQQVLLASFVHMDIEHAHSHDRTIAQWHVTLLFDSEK